MKKIAFAAMLLAALPLAAHAEIQGDPEKGKKVFNKCKACHFVDREKNKVGPHLVNIVGRKSASVEGFRYSKAALKMSEEGLVWTEEKLFEYLENPRKFMPGTKMAFAGLKKPEDRANLIAYLKSMAK